jgi:hypothetical protein
MRHMHRTLEREKLLQDSHRILRTLDGMANSARVVVDFAVVTALEPFVSEKVNGGIVDSRDLLLCLDVLEAVCLVPAGREDIKRDLSADGVTGNLLGIRFCANRNNSRGNTYVRP